MSCPVLYVVTNRESFGWARRVYLADGSEIPNVRSFEASSGPNELPRITLELMGVDVCEVTEPPKRK